jgi:hypothetical protein
MQAMTGIGAERPLVGDVSEIPELLDQIDADVASMTADGAYDGETVYDAVAERHPAATVVIAPRTTAIARETTASQRNRHLAIIEKHGRMGWQRSSSHPNGAPDRPILSATRA